MNKPDDMACCPDEKPDEKKVSDKGSCCPPGAGVSGLGFIDTSTSRPEEKPSAG